jgi:site-specific DNA recombinase
LTRQKAIPRGPSAWRAAPLPRDEEAGLRLRIEACSRGRDETIDIAMKAFELSQDLRAKWFEADYAAKRRILEIVSLNWKLVSVSLVPKMRKPFDNLAEGLVSEKSRGDWI